MRRLEFRKCMWPDLSMRQTTWATYPWVIDDPPALLSRPFPGWENHPFKQSNLISAVRFVTSSEGHWTRLLRAICFLFAVQTQIYKFASCFDIAGAKCYTSLPLMKLFHWKQPLGIQILPLQLKGTEVLEKEPVVCQGPTVFHSVI